MFLSIIIPVYNSARYLPKCLGSIWSQGLPEDDYEVICVDDRSTDDSLGVLLKEATLHPRLRVLQNSTNLRAGGARNHGVREAKGEYIQFIDSDDYFQPSSLKKAYEYQKEHKLDILMCDSSRECLGFPSNSLVHHFSNMSVITGRAFMVENSLPFAPWKYFFERSLMTDNDVWFEECVNCEDVDWTHKLAFYAKTMQYQPILLIHYVLMPSSETGAEYRNINTIQNRFFSARRVLILKDLYLTSSEHQHLDSVALCTYLVGVKSMCASSASPKRKRKIIDDYFEWNFKNAGFFYQFIVHFPTLFAVSSTLFSPIVRIVIWAKRVIKGR